MSRLIQVYKKLLQQLGQQADGRMPSFARWWPVSGKFRPPEMEICVGSILTQNTNWKNVEKALENLVKAKKLAASSIASCPLPALKKLVRPSGFYRQKARRLKEFSRFVAGFDGDFYSDVTREQLLAIKGIGRETADSMLLYACGRPYFVIDVYTRRLFSRLGMISGEEDYDELREMFENALPKDAALYREFHALIVEHEKRSKAKEKRA